MRAAVRTPATSMSQSPPLPSRALLSDLRHFLLRRPRIPTLIEADSPAQRQDYAHRIRQRLGVCVADYSVLNIHRIGIRAPASLVFQELTRWDGSSSCWPNHLAEFERIDGFRDVRILLLGMREYPFGLRRSLFGLEYIPLFRLNAIDIQTTPGARDPDNARYLLFRCSGGYPIGVFAIYVRSSIAALGEVEQTQCFMVVGFDFYGRGTARDRGIVGRVWEVVHNRVTSNVMNRFKALCEWRFERVREGR